MIAGIFITEAYPAYAPVHSVVVSTTIISQILFLGCPIVTVQQLIKRKYLGEPDAPAFSFTGLIVKKIFGVQLSPLGAALIVVTVLVINSCYCIYKMNH